ncbi:MAG TPA: cellulase family glycosylhydrolase [Micromonosporaceae bacterium]|nr:cellulase family glycosylhydrolase [Micromonosporaceae bacterium]
MKRLTALAATAIAVTVASVFLVAPPAHAATGFYVSDGRLYDANGSDFVMRGVNHPYAWSPGENRAFADIKNLGANTVRVVLSNGDDGSAINSVEDVAAAIALCRDNRLICVLELHNTTGYGDVPAVSLDRAADFWIGARSALVGQERYAIINIGNEPFGNSDASPWTADTTNAIQRLRGNGLTHTIMVDAPNWGQDWTLTMRDNAASVFQSDPIRNTVFSIHMYGVYDTADKVAEYLTAFVDAGLPLVIGEFGFNHSDGDPDEDAIMSYAESLRLGYLGWSWSGNGGGVEYLDMTNEFDADSLTWWGDRIFNGANGIRATAREATVFSGAAPAPTTIVGTQSGRCVDVPNVSQVNGTQVVLWDCAGNANQRFAYTAAQELRVYGTKCLEARLAGRTNGTAVVINDCTGGAHQTWTLGADGAVANNDSGLCLDAVGRRTVNGTPVNLWTCNGQTNQRWTRR